MDLVLRRDPKNRKRLFEIQKITESSFLIPLKHKLEKSTGAPNQCIFTGGLHSKTLVKCDNSLVNGQIQEVRDADQRVRCQGFLNGLNISPFTPRALR